MDVAAVPSPLGPRLGCERRYEPVRRGDAADRLPDEDLLVRGPKGRSVSGRDLLLAVTQLSVVLLEQDPLPLEGFDKRVDVLLRRGHTDRREAEARVDRTEPSVGSRGERELVLEPDVEQRAPIREPLFHPLQERP